MYLLLEMKFLNTHAPVYCKSQQPVRRWGVRSLPFHSVAHDLDTVTNTEGHHQTPESLQGPLHKSSSAPTGPLIHSDYLPTTLCVVLVWA